MSRTTCSQGGGLVAGRIISVRAAKEFRPCLEIYMHLVHLCNSASSTNICECSYSGGKPWTVIQYSPIDNGHQKRVRYDGGVVQTVQRLQWSPPFIERCMSSCSIDEGVGRGYSHVACYSPPSQVGEITELRSNSGRIVYRIVPKYSEEICPSKQCKE